MIRRLPLSLRAACLALALHPAAALAHAILMASTPAAGAHVPAGALAITLRFNSLIDVARSRLTLIGPDQQQTRLPIAAGGQGDLMTGSAHIAAGANTLRWQVLAVDGHITRGDIPFAADPAPTAPGH